MSSRAGNSLNRKRMEQLLKAVGSERGRDAEQVEFTEYDWRKPHYFSSDQLVRLDGFASTAAQAMTKRFSEFCHACYDVRIASVTQHFAEQYLDNASESDQTDYCVLFGAAPDSPTGLIGMPEQTASAWTKQLLGDSESEDDSTRELSSLEESLLLDLTSALIEAFSESSPACNFCLTGNVIKGRIPLDLSGTEVLCKISFDVKKADSDEGSAAYLIIPCRELAPVVGKTVAAAGGFSANEVSRAILDHMQEMTVIVTAQLDSTTLTFEEVMNLQVNDMLLLEKTVDEPIELIVEGKAVFSGRPAKSGGKYAAVIGAMLDGETA